MRWASVTLLERHATVAKRIGIDTRRRTVQEKARMVSQQTLVVRVTPWRDLFVWRDLELRLDQTLHDLHLAIQDAFELDNDHLYAFYMNGHAFDLEFRYEGSPDDARPSARDVLLGQFTFPVNKRFLYLFDFGDELRHHVKVISYGSVDSAETYPRIVASEGKAPPQYDESPIEDEGSNPSEESESDDARLSEPMRQRLSDLVPRIEQAIERQQDRVFGDDVSESQMRVDLAEEYAVACKLFDVANGDVRTIHVGIERTTSWSIWDWLCDLPSELSGASLHEEALDLARRVHTVVGAVELRIRLPGFLQRAKREQEARVMLEENLREFPEDARVHLEAAELELGAGDLARAEFHYREARKWVGSQMQLRETILRGLKELLQKTDQTKAIQTLLQQEEDVMRAAFPHRYAHSPIRRQAPKVGRNDPCPCGSGKKSKKCCGRS